MMYGTTSLKSICSIFRRRESSIAEFSSPEDETERLSRIVGKKLPVLAA